MGRVRNGLYVWVRHSASCKLTDIFTRRCRCPKQIAGVAGDGARIRKAAQTGSWERAEKHRARLEAEHDPLNKPVFDAAQSAVTRQTAQKKTIADAVADYMASKQGTNRSYETVKQDITLFERHLLIWSREQGIWDLAELDLENITRFRNTWKNNGATTNRKTSRLRNFFRYCQRRHWINENPAELLESSTERSVPTDYFRTEEWRRILDATFASHDWHGGHDFQHRAERTRALLLFMRWTGLAIIDCVRFSPDRMRRDAHGVWTVMLRRTKNGKPVFVAIPPQIAETVLAVPPLSERHFFWSGNGVPQTGTKDWRRTIARVFKAAQLKRNGKPLRCHLHMIRDTFAIEKLEGGATLEEVSLLLGHSSVKITERHYLPWDRRRQERLTRASMVDWKQIEEQVPRRSRSKLVVMTASV